MKKEINLICCTICMAVILSGCVDNTTSSSISEQMSSQLATSTASEQSVSSIVISYDDSSVEHSSQNLSLTTSSYTSSMAIASSSSASSKVSSSKVSSSKASSVAVSSLAVSSAASSAISSIATSSTQTDPNPIVAKEMRGVWVSYLELTNLGGYEQYKTNINNMFDKIKAQGLNTIFFHVRPYSDALYNSKLFPWSHVLNSGAVQGVNPGYDPLEYAVGAAHARGLELHAWVNPYRVWTKSSNIYDLASNNPARIWRTDADPSNDSWVLTDPDKAGIYYNPAIPQVRKLIVDGISEIVNNYDVDGVHFDDYFYGSSTTAFDAVTYNAYKNAGGRLSLADWRLDNVNQLIKEVYSTVKSIRNIPFGISPMANITSDYSSHYADVKLWASQNGYVDYLAPQIYFGYQNASLPFTQTVELWRNTVVNPTVKLYIGLATYKLGNQDYYAGASGLNEWIGTTDIMQRMVKTARNNNVDGFILFSYGAIVNQSNAGEMSKLKELLQ